MSTDHKGMPENIPLLPLKNAVLFPKITISVKLERDSSANLMRDASNNRKIVGVIAQKNRDENAPMRENIYTTGTLGFIKKLENSTNGKETYAIQGYKSFKIKDIIQDEPYIRCTYDIIEPKSFRKTVSLEKEIAQIKEMYNTINTTDNTDTFEHLIQRRHLDDQVENLIQRRFWEGQNEGYLINYIAANSLDISLSEKQKILETSTLLKKAQLIKKGLNVKYHTLQLRKDVQSQIKDDLDQQQKEFILQQEAKAIQEKLGTGGSQREIEEFKTKAAKKTWSEKVKDIFDRELSRFERMSTQSPEYSIQYNYLDFLTDLPWNKCSTPKFSLKKAIETLDTHHFGLEDVKERVVEFLAMLQLKENPKNPIICLHGPPGVGKTSLGKSIAQAMNREYVRMSLGGMRDEAEIRGHRKTYIGAMPGRILQSLRKVKVSNPVFVLDEIDKVSGIQGFGAPASALLEVLDPEQNAEFHDNYLEMSYDLSKVFFIATANSLSEIHPALLDRMEIINVSGYTVEEKTQIGKKYLLPKQLESYGLTKKGLNISEKEMAFIVENYTHESGVRNLDRRIGKIIRQTAKKEVLGTPYKKLINKSEVENILGIPNPHTLKLQQDTVGVVMGLAWTPVGGVTLYVESALSPGKGTLEMTGNLGKVMKESATIALQYIKSNAEYFGIDLSLFTKKNIHIHVPEGATPKDGPSAGITMFTSLLSLLTQKKVSKNVAMTGEITLRGSVLPVGGIKEKVLAAKRLGIESIILCRENKKDIDKINERYLKGVQFHYVDKMSQVAPLSLI